MHAAIIGADGMLGRKLAAALVARPAIGENPISRLTLADIRQPAIAGPDVDYLVGDMSEPATAARLVAAAPDVIFHVAATFMGQADADFAAGYRINFGTVFTALEAIRLGKSPPPRFVHASSIGVFGPPFPELIPDDFLPRPDSSYGTQKLMSEAVVNDYSRHCFIDGVALRLPTIAIRPGAPTHGNSGFFSNIIREPLAGRRAELPAATDVRHWLASPRSAIGYLLHAATMPTAPLGRDRVLTMPGLAVSVADQLEALRAIAGEAAVDRIDRLADPPFRRQDFPQAFAATRALSLGFAPQETSFGEIVQFHVQEAGETTG